MRKNHHGKKDRLVKRVFALCLALAVICTCLVPVFATEGLIDPQVNQEASRPVDDGEASYPDDEFAGFGEEEATRPVDGGEAAGFGEDEVATRPVEGGEDNLDGGPNVKETEWGTVIEYGPSSSTGTDPVTQWSGEDDVVEKPDDKVVVSGDEIKKLQDMVVYRFWLKELNANDLQDITAQAQINNMTESEYLARNGEVLWNLYFIQAVPRAETIADYSSYIENPSSNRDPKGELRQFDYWYTLDEFGNRVRLNLTDPTSNILDDKTTTVNVYAAWKDGTVGSDEEEDVDHEDLVDKNPVPVDLTAKASTSYEDEDGNTKSVNLPVEVKNLPSAAHSLSVIHMGDDDMERFYESHEDSFGEMMPILGLKISPKNAKGETVQPAKGEKATVTVSGLDALPYMVKATAGELKVLHQTADGSVETLDVLSYQNGTLTFETSSFSPFVVVRTDGYAVDTLDINSITNVSIKDDIANSGHYVLEITADGKDYEGEKAGKLLKDNGFTVTWKKDGTVVDRSEKTNGVYSREENGGWVDVVYTDGANKTYTVTVTKDNKSLNAISTVNYNDELQNYSFEDVKSTGTSALSDNSNNNNPLMAWKTTADDHKIEVGNTTYQSNKKEYQYEDNRWTQKPLTQTEYSYAQTVTVKKVYKLEGNGSNAKEIFTLVQVGNGVVKSGDATSAPELGTITGATFEAGTATAEGVTGNITIALPEYTKVGVYEYTLKEVSTNKFAGVSYFEGSIKLVVSVVNGTNGQLRVAAVHTEGYDAQGNYLGAKSDTFTNTYSANSIAVTKTVEGNLGDKTKEFGFTIDFEKADNESAPTGITYTVGDETKTVSFGADGNAQVKFTLKNGQTLNFVNVPKSVKYTVTEDDYTNMNDPTKGYTTTVSVNGGNSTTSLTSNAQTMTKDAATVAFTNTKGATIDTGVILDNAPYIALLAIVAIGGVALMLNKRRRDEE